MTSSLGRVFARQAKSSSMSRWMLSAHGFSETISRRLREALIRHGYHPKWRSGRKHRGQPGALKQPQFRQVQEGG